MKPMLFILALIPALLTIGAQVPETIDSDYIGTIKSIKSGSIFIEDNNETYYIIVDSTDHYRIGQTVEGSSDFSQVDGKDTFFLFVKSNGADFYSYDNPEVIEESNSMRNKLYDGIYNSDSKYSDYVTSLLYKRTTEDNEYIFDISNDLGISHLFVVSGFHISLFIGLINKITSKLKNKKVLRNMISFSITSCFLWLIFMPPTGIRALLSTMIKDSTSLSPINALALTSIIFFILNPWILFTSSMLLSFGVTFAIHLIIQSKPKGKIFTTSLISLAAYTISLTITATWNTQFNILAPIYTIILSPVVSIMYILIIFTLPFYYLTPILDPIFNIMDLVMVFLSSSAVYIIKDILTWTESIILFISTIMMIIITKDRSSVTFSTLLINLLLINI